ncbi:hypothetical protein LCGC14_0845490 [marine sediment metagenome]|uniref:Uncharacterized protein n=1 Tax=marine sediment metagenome TaxID=412755 RepID=A0A0F9SIZ7_9ZZZZ
MINPKIIAARIALHSIVGMLLLSLVLIVLFGIVAHMEQQDGRVRLSRGPVRMLLEPEQPVVYGMDQPSG